MPKTSRAALALILCLPLLHACGGASDDGYVRLVNATTDYSTISLVESDDDVGAAVASDTVGSYVGVGANTYDFDLLTAGSSSTAATTSQTVAKGDHFTLVAYVDAGTLKTATLTDDEDKPACASSTPRRRWRPAWTST